MIRRPPRSTPLYSSAASDVYKRQVQTAGEYIQTVYRPEIQTATKRGWKLQTVIRAKEKYQARTFSICSYGLYFSPTFCSGLYLRSVYGLYEIPSSLYTVCISLPRLLVVGSYAWCWSVLLSLSRLQLSVSGLRVVCMPRFYWQQAPAATRRKLVSYHLVHDWHLSQSLSVQLLWS